MIVHLWHESIIAAAFAALVCRRASSSTPTQGSKPDNEVGPVGEPTGRPQIALFAPARMMRGLGFHIPLSRFGSRGQRLSGSRNDLMVGNPTTRSDDRVDRGFGCRLARFQKFIAHRSSRHWWRKRASYVHTFGRSRAASDIYGKYCHKMCFVQ